MSSVLRSTDPILLETHIKDCLISLRDGANVQRSHFRRLAGRLRCGRRRYHFNASGFPFNVLVADSLLPSLEQIPKVRHSLALFFLLGEGGIRARRVFAPIHDQNHDLYRHPAYDVCLCNWSRRTTW